MDHTAEQDQEHGVYGGKIRDEDEMDTDFKMSTNEAQDIDNNSIKDFEDMKNILKKIEENLSRSSATQTEMEKRDARTIFISNVHYACTPEEVYQHFESCGAVSSVRILKDKSGKSRGIGYVEFRELESLQNSLLLNESEFHGRQIKVTPTSKRKRINVQQFRGVTEKVRTRSKPGQRCPKKALPGPVQTLMKGPRKRRGPAHMPPLKPSPLSPHSF